MASSVYFSSFNECCFVSVDGFGDFASTVLGYYNDNKIHQTHQVLFPHSLGVFYTGITQHLGFWNYGDEYKVMGLASYGVPKYIDTIKKIFKNNNNLFELNLEYFNHHKGKVDMTWLDQEPVISKIFNDKIFNLIGEGRNKTDKISQFHMDIAASAQKVFEDELVKLCNKIYSIFPSSNLCLSGGCAMNSVANGKLKNRTKFKNIFIPSSPADSGGAIGAASVVVKKKFNNIVSQHDPY